MARKTGSGLLVVVVVIVAGAVFAPKLLGMVIMDAAKMSYIARNISLAWGEGKQSILHKDSAGRDGRYNTVCKRVFVKKYDNGSCDEYPFASTDEGGSGARTEEVQRARRGTDPRL